MEWLSVWDVAILFVVGAGLAGLWWHDRRELRGTEDRMHQYRILIDTRFHRLESMPVATEDRVARIEKIIEASTTGEDISGLYDFMNNIQGRLVSLETRKLTPADLPSHDHFHTHEHPETCKVHWLKHQSTEWTNGKQRDIWVCTCCQAPFIDEK